MNIDAILAAHGLVAKKSRDKIPPPNVIGFSATASGEDIKLTWTNPKDSDYVGVIIVKKTGDYPTDVKDGETIFNGNTTTFIDRNVVKAEYIYYRAFAYDFDDNINTEDVQVAKAVVKGEQTAPEAPKIEKADYFSVTLVSQKNYQYKIANGSWQNENVFSGLMSDTEYTFYQRKIGNELYKPSPSSDGTVTKTLKAPLSKVTAIIDQSNSNPLTCVTYDDDAKILEKGSPEWDEFFGTKLVLFKNGKEVRDLEDAELNSLKPEDGDVMVKFKRMGLNIKTIGDKVYVTMTNNPNDGNFKYYAHTRGSEARDAFYLGAYLGYEANGRLRSIRNVLPTGNKTISYFRNLAQANGKGYDQFAFYQLVFIQAMYVLKYGNLDSQTVIGKGLTKSKNSNTGGTNGKGINFGSSSPTMQMRFQYLEDLYGNKNQWIDGCNTIYGSFWTGMDNFNNNKSGYKSFTASSLSYAYPIHVWGDSERGFIGKSGGGSSTTFYCDSFNMSPKDKYFTNFGGDNSSVERAGMFSFNCSYSDTFSYASTGARLMFL